MLKLLVVPVAFLLLTVACSKQPSTTDSSAPANQPNAAAPGSPAPSPAVRGTTPRAEAPAPVTLPAGTVIYVRLNNAVSSKTSQAGERFQATVQDDVQVGGNTAIPRGSTASGVVSEARARGRFKGGALLRLELQSVTVNGANYPVHATISRAMKGKGKRSTVAIGGGAGLGALIGGLAGGGKGAAIGAAAGAGAGTAGAAFTGNKDITLPAETSLAFELREATTLKK